ncbi:MAG TPA: response regulator [Polyangiaceae bacterium]
MNPILVVDDSLTVRMDLTEAFEEAGFPTVAASTLAQARELVTTKKPSLVVLDVILPDGDGLSLLRELRTDPSTQATPILLLSTEAEVKDRILGLQTGADDYIGKPYDSLYVVARARELVRKGDLVDTTKRTSILVIDDSVTFRSTLADALGEAGYEVFVAPTGEDGLRLAVARKPTAIVCDSNMPGIDGATVIRRIRLDAALRGTPCILLTASEGADVEVSALDAGADAFVRKELDVELILARIAAVLRSATTERRDADSLLGPKRILAVDDDDSYLQEVSALLRGEGYDVVLARSGEETLALLGAQPVDCILLDLQMAGMDGAETCRRIKDAPIVRDIPLVMLAQEDDRESMMRALEAGAEDFIAKTSELDVLKARVQAQLRRKQFEDEARKVREELLRSEIRAAEERTARLVAEARASLVEELERKNKELEAFAYSVSHDLRAPLRTIDGFSQALVEDCADSLDDMGRSYLDRVRAAAKRMGELIDDMLELSRVGRAELLRADVDLSSVAREVTTELEKREPERKVTFAITPDLHVSADARLLKIILENLIGNAWKFTSKKPHATITVGVTERGKNKAYFVADDGAGFDQAYADKLFAPFKRLHTEAEFPGTGIGLATVHRVVDRHGGTIWAEGKLGEGATILFTLPST